MEWILRKESREFISSCGRYKIKNAGAKNGVMYGVWTLAKWSCQGEGFEDFVQLVKVGTLEECMKFGGVT